jgi:hypothetical protein
MTELQKYKNNKNKTLIGLDGHLFLINDACKEIEVHNNNLCLVKNNLNLIYGNIKNKYFLTIFPNKSLVNKKYLPNIFDLKYRPNFDKYKNFLGDFILDGYNIINNEMYYYKTDTHANFLGGYTIYCYFIDSINKLFNLNLNKRIITINKKPCILNDLGLGLGDLTMEINLGDQILENKLDDYYYSDEFENIYNCKIINNNDNLRIMNFHNNILKDITELCENLIIDWNIISKNILYKKNELNNKIKVIIFYDSFLTSCLSLYLELFNEVYLSKSNIDNNLINFIKPDYIFEFRVERFLF